jgi:hypothetical protein
LEERPGANDDLTVVTARVEPVEPNSARGGTAEAKQCLDDGRLAGSVGSEQRDDLTEIDVEGHAVNCTEFGEVDAKMIDLDSVTHDP